MTDFSDWNDLLHEYVDSQGQVNYQAWKNKDFQTLTHWLSTLEFMELDPNLTLEQQLALWINLYNAFTIATVLERYPIASIRPSILGLPNWVAFLRFFQRRVYRFAGQTYSLGDIEHKILRDRLQDPRIHFAIVCASIGCPALRNQAYTPERVMPQLEEDVIRFVHNPEKVRYEAKTDTLHCSKIFKWYQQDFLTVAPSIPEYIHTYMPNLPLSSTSSITYLYYDWSLNQRIS
jgi:Protein of unknown function, DUF547